MSTQQEIQKEYESFLQEVLTNEEVWLLQNDEGMACQSSLEYEGRMCILIWSNFVLAESEREGDFEELESVNLPLVDFIFKWLPNMQDEQVICALNWREDDGGMEVEPKDLLEHLKLILPDELMEKYKTEIEA